MYRIVLLSITFFIQQSIYSQTDFEQETDSSKLMKIRQAAMIDSLISDNYHRLSITNPADISLKDVIRKYDKLVTNEWEVYVVKIKHITATQVQFLYPYNPQLQTINREETSQLLYADGRHEVFLPLIRTSESDKINLRDVEVREPDDWRKVFVTEDAAIADTMYEVAAIESEFIANKMNVNSKYLDKNAKIILKKKAANLFGSHLLITDKKVVRTYGEFPEIYMKAIVYSSEKIEE